MSQHMTAKEDWEFLIGYPWEEAELLLEEEAVDFEVKFTAPPSKAVVVEDALVIAVRPGEPLTIICASPDWTIS